MADERAHHAIDSATGGSGTHARAWHQPPQLALVVALGGALTDAVGPPLTGLLWPPLHPPHGAPSRDVVFGALPPVGILWLAGGHR